MRASLMSVAGLLSATAFALPAVNVNGPLQTPPKDLGSLAFPNISTIIANPQSNFKSYNKGDLVRSHNGTSTHAKRWECASPILTWGDNDNGGKGITITNGDNGGWRGFYVHHNGCDAVPYKYIWVAPGATQFVSIPDGFEGRIIRGVDQFNLGPTPQMLATWFEFSFSSDGKGWADVSLIRGCDGGSLTWSLDGSGAWKGFTDWILDGAPSNAYDKKQNGQWVLKYTENSDGSINTAPRDWEIQKIGTDLAYVDDYHGNPVISSSNGRFGTYWPGGRA